MSTRESDLASPNNPYWRMHAPSKAAHLLVTKKKDGPPLIRQFPTDSPFCRPIEFDNKDSKEDGDTLMKIEPSGKRASSKKTASSKAGKPVSSASPSTPTVKKSKSRLPLMETSPGGTPETVYTPEGTKLTSKRKYDVMVSGEEPSKLLLFSPIRNAELAALSRVHKARPKKKGVRKLPLNLTSDQGIKKLPSNLPKTKENLPSASKNSSLVQYKGGDEVFLTQFYRNRKKAKSQKSVMKKTARKELIEAIEQKKENLKPHIYQIMKTFIEEEYAIEWLHNKAFKLCPEEIEPQDEANLAAAGKWINTLMMVLENVANYFLENVPAVVSITPTFKLVGGANIIDVVTYSVKIIQDEKEVIISHEIDALELPNSTNWPSTSDTPQIIHVAKALLG